MKIREHRGLLADSMETVKEIPNTMQAVLNEVNLSWSNTPRKFCLDDISVKYYCYDERIKWDCYIVEIKGVGVHGFTDQRPTVEGENFEEELRKDFALKQNGFHISLLK